MPRPFHAAWHLDLFEHRAGLQCAKRHYREIHARELATPFDKGTQAVLDAGTRVGEVDRDRVSGKGEREAD